MGWAPASVLQYQLLVGDLPWSADECCSNLLPVTEMDVGVQRWLPNSWFQSFDSDSLQTSSGDANSSLARPGPPLSVCSGSLGSTDTQPLNFHIIPPSPYKLLVACLVVAAAPATFFLLLIIAARVGGSQSEPLPWRYATCTRSVGWGKQQR